MTTQEFEQEMRRLVNQFGKAAYSQERLRLMYLAVQDYSHDWWRRVVDKLLGECRQPPLMPELRAEIAAERERVYRTRREEEKQEGQDFWAGRLMPEDKALIVQTMRRRLVGELSDTEWERFNQLMQQLPGVTGAARTTFCPVCADGGVVVATRKGSSNPAEYTFRCNCSAGTRDARNYPVWGPNLAAQFDIAG